MKRSTPIMYLAFIVIAMIVFQETVFAVESAVEGASETVSESIVTSDNNIDFSESSVNISAFLKMLLGLTGIIILIFVLAWLSRRMKLVQNFTSGYQIRNLASLSISTREKICLIEVGDKQLLVGVAPGNISQLHVFKEKIEINTEDSTAKTNNLFSRHLKNALGTADTKGKSK